MRVLGISGSLRAGSYNSQLLRAAQQLLPDGAQLELYPGLRAIPPFDVDDEGAPDAAVVGLREAIAGADALLVATPEYNSSLPGQLKNALDWASRPVDTSVLRNLPTAVISASAGQFGAVWAQAEARKTLSASGARVLDSGVALGSAAQGFAGDGTLANPTLAADLRALLAELDATVAARARRLTAAA